MRILKEPYQVFELYPIDSDTLKAWVQIDKTTRHLWRIRLKGVEGGELDTAEGHLGRDILASLIRDKLGQAAHFFGNVDCLDKYARHVGDIQFQDGSRLCGALIAYGHHWRKDRTGKETKNNKPQTIG
jgi:hypothetical protein